MATPLRLIGALLQLMATPLGPMVPPLEPRLSHFRDAHLQDRRVRVRLAGLSV